MELEGLTFGVTGKLALWENLRELAEREPGLAGFDLDALAERARAQLERVRAERLRGARLGLG